MARQQVPTAVVVVAIFHFIIGGLGLLSNLCGGIILLVTGGDLSRLVAFVPEAQRQMEVQQRILNERVPFYALYQGEGLVVGLVFSVLLIASGVGLLRLRPWGRTLSLVYVPLSIPQTLFGAFYTFVYVNPATQEAVRQTPQPNLQAAQVSAQASGMMTTMLTAFIFLVVLAYPVIVLIVMMLPSVVAAFRGGTVRTEPEDYRDPDEPGGFTEPDDRFRSGGR
jgi:hypothetical protein